MREDAFLRKGGEEKLSGLSFCLLDTKQDVFYSDMFVVLVSKVKK